MGVRALGPGRLVIASHNAGKVTEVGDLLRPFGVDSVSAAMLGLAEPAETGTSFVENARIKAHAAARAANLPALADDSGLSVAALDGAPGVYSADWAERQWFEGSPGRDWYLAMGKIEGRLAQLGAHADRSAWFSSVLVLAWPDGDEQLFEGRVNGHLIWPPRGERGFGYDPIFIADGMDRTFAEIDPAEKNRISHRADAFTKLVAALF